MKEGSTITFSKLASEVDLIQIPILQRDYAQGRKEAVEVRRKFLSAIKNTLTDNCGAPLDLDFVYGSFEDDLNIFSVLDGQQRLTTLFLLHWYLALKDGYVDLFKDLFVMNGKSKFTYKTRVSASEFFTALALASDVELNDSEIKLSDQIADKQWFYLSWKSDPTVQSCLTMLDAIHENFYSCEEGLWKRLIDIESPYVVFQYLNLESFGLSDELYIKMNARGKPLTDFENFKAWLCSKLDNEVDGKSIERKIDQEWTDVFWKLSDESNDEFDKLYLRFFNLMAFYRACECADSSFELLDDDLKAWLRKLRTSNGYISTDDLERFKSFDEESITRFISVLDFFYSNMSSADIREILENSITNNDYVRQLKFYAYILFIQKNMRNDVWTDETVNEFNRWQRVADNLINNHRIDEMTPFLSSIRNLLEISEHCGAIYEFLSNDGISSGFTKEQREEESRKASLILNDIEWEKLLVKYERHEYFQGKVGFLLDMATDKNGIVDKKKFDEVSVKVAGLFSDNILRSNEFILERALLTFDDYLVNDSGYRYSFCLPNKNTYRERSENWLQVVKKSCFTDLVNELSEDIEGSLYKIIDGADCGGWRQLIINHPYMIRYCQKRLVHKEGEVVYLLSKSSFRGYHSELRTYAFNKMLRDMDANNILPKEIESYRYVEVYGDNMPYIHIRISDDVYDIIYNISGFSLWLDEGESKTMPEILVKLLQEKFPGETINV